jgi:arsenite methyltransferase
MTLPRLSMLPTFLREWLGKRRFPREPEPDLVMDEKDQVEAYRVAGRIDGVMAAHYLYQTSRISQVVQGRGTVLDLGCGPATQLVQIAELNPATRFIGVDLSDEMLKEARDHAAARGLSNVEFRKQDMTRLEAFPDHSVDGVISTLAFHHLPTQAHLEKTLREVTRVLRPDGALYLIDFGRLKSLRSVLFFSYMNADHQPHLFSRDYERSLRAAFTREEFEALAARCLPPSARLLTTFRIPFLVVLKTEDRPLPAPTAERLRSLAEALSPRYKNDLEEMRLFFGLGGFGPDPFSSTPPVAVAAKQWMALFHDAPFRRRLPVSTLARGARALRLFVRAAYWRRRVERARRAEETARRRHRESEAQALERFGDVLTGELGRLKGPLMKFGQMLSYVGESLPAPVREKLKNLQDHAAPIAPGRIRQIIEAELGRPLRDAFLEFVDAPIAAASISQLHLARRRDGRWVVVKVKYPGIAEAVRSDISLLRFVAPFLKGLLNIGNAKEVLEELQTADSGGVRFFPRSRPPGHLRPRVRRRSRDRDPGRPPRSFHVGALDHGLRSGRTVRRLRRAGRQGGEEPRGHGHHPHGGHLHPPPLRLQRGPPPGQLSVLAGRPGVFPGFWFHQAVVARVHQPLQNAKPRRPERRFGNVRANLPRLGLHFGQSRF